MKFSKTIHFQYLLVIVLIFLCLLINALNIDSNFETNNNFLFLSNLLCLETAAIFLWSKSINNNLLLLLGINSMVYYILRIVTLIIFPPATYILHNNLSTLDYEIALKVILVFLPSIAICIAIFDKKCQKSFHSIEQNNNKNNFPYVLWIFYFGLLLSITREFAPIDIIVTIATYAGLIIQKDLILFFTIIYFLTKYSLLSKKQKRIFVISFIIYVLLDTLIGNKSSVYKFVLFLMFALFALNTSLVIKLRYIFIGVFIGLIGIYLFFVGNVIRFQEKQSGEQKLSSAFTVISEVNPTYFLDYGDIAGAQLSGRIGFLDYTAKTIKFSASYEPIFNFNYYLGSIIDYSIPGFNTFNYLRVSNGIMAIDLNGKVPTKSEYEAHYSYTSDCITMFAEFFLLGKGLLGGLFILILFIPTVLILFNLWILKSKTTIKRNIIKGIEFYCFSEFILISFGLDWGISSFLFLLIFFKIFHKYYE